nr:coproporphyrinogen III oxidase [Bacteroidota bacterium]
WNIANLRKYMDAIANGLVAMEREGLSIVQRYNEYILTSLRTMWGTDLAKVRIDFGDQTHLYLSKALVGPLKAGMVVAHGHFVKLTRKGKFFADMVAADLFLV